MHNFSFSLYDCVARVGGTDKLFCLTTKTFCVGKMYNQKFGKKTEPTFPISQLADHERMNVNN